MNSCINGVVHVLVLGHNSRLTPAVNVAHFIANAVNSDKCVLLHCQDMDAGSKIAELLSGAGLVEAPDDSALEDWYKAAIILDINDF